MTTEPTFPIVASFPADWPVTFNQTWVEPVNHRVELARLPQLPPLDPSLTETPMQRQPLAAGDGYRFWVGPDGGRSTYCDQPTVCPPWPDGGDGPAITALAYSEGLLATATADGTVTTRRVRDGQLVELWTGLPELSDLTAGPDGEFYAAAATGIVRLAPAGRWSYLVPLRGVASISAWSNYLVVSTDRDRSLHRVELTTGQSTVLGSAPTEGTILRATPEGWLLVADPNRGEIRVLDLIGGSTLGSFGGEPIPFGAITVDTDGTVWLAYGHHLRSCGDPHPVSEGRVVIGPIDLPVDPGEGNDRLLRLKAKGRFSPSSVRITAHFDRADGSVPATAESAAPWLDDRLITVPAGARSVTVTVTLRSSGDPKAANNPALAQVELRSGETALIEFLPQIYRSQGDPTAFLDPFLRLLGSADDDVIDTFIALADQLDPDHCLDDRNQPWLDWLAGWVDADIDQSWPSPRRRSVVADAFETHQRRGTPQAIEDRIELETGLTATIITPGELASVWSLGADDTELGLTSMVTPAPADGAIVGITAIVDRSHLITTADRGAPLFGDLAHRFNVIITDPMSNDQRAAVKTIVERERPAHTRGHICHPTGGIRLGLGGRIGIDLIVGEPARPNTVDGLEGFALGSAPLRV